MSAMMGIGMPYTIFMSRFTGLGKRSPDVAQHLKFTASIG